VTINSIFCNIRFLISSAISPILSHFRLSYCTLLLFK